MKKQLTASGLKNVALLVVILSTCITWMTRKIEENKAKQHVKMTSVVVDVDEVIKYNISADGSFSSLWHNFGGRKIWI